MRYHFIDRIKRIEYDKQIVALKGVTQTEDFFEDHFVGFPVMPGALMIEAMAQACGALIEISSSYKAFSILLMVEKMKFKKMVHPGTVLTITADMVSRHPESAMLETKIEVEEKIVASGTLVVGIATAESQGASFGQAIQTLESYFAFMLKEAEIVR